MSLFIIELQKQLDELNNKMELMKVENNNK